MIRSEPRKKYCDVINFSLNRAKMGSELPSSFFDVIFTHFYYYFRSIWTATVCAPSACVCLWLKIYFYCALHNTTKKWARTHIKWSCLKCAREKFKWFWSDDDVMVARLSCGCCCAIDEQPEGFKIPFLEFILDYRPVLVIPCTGGSLLNKWARRETKAKARKQFTQFFFSYLQSSGGEGIENGLMKTFSFYDICAVKLGRKSRQGYWARARIKLQAFPFPKKFFSGLLFRLPPHRLDIDFSNRSARDSTLSNFRASFCVAVIFDMLHPFPLRVGKHTTNGTTWQRRISSWLYYEHETRNFSKKEEKKTFAVQSESLNFSWRLFMISRRCVIKNLSPWKFFCCSLCNPKP